MGHVWFNARRTPRAHVAGVAPSRYEDLASYRRARAPLEGESSSGIGGALKGISVTEVISIGEPRPRSPDERIDRALAESAGPPKKCLQRIAHMHLGVEDEARKHLPAVPPAVTPAAGQAAERS